jgi:hypothetical protein
MIWWLIGGFWIGFLCGMFAMCIFIARKSAYMDMVAEEDERPAGDPPKVSVTSHT